MPNSDHDNLLRDMDQRVTRLETIVGEGPDEGLRADLRTMRETLEAATTRIYLAIGGGAVLLTGAQAALQVYLAHR